MLNTDFASALFGPTRRREFRATISAWRRAERAWLRSGVAREGPTGLADRIAGRVIDPEIADTVVGSALVEVIREFVLWEDLGDLEVDWRAVEASPSEAIQLRRILGRRLRWARESAANVEAIARAVRRGLRELTPTLGEASLLGHDGGEAVFGVPLIELIATPAVVIEHMSFAPYDGAGRELLVRVRQVIERNLIAASGLPPTANLRDQANKVVLPTKQKGRSASQLADLYLAGTPWRRFLSTPVPFHIPDEIRYEHAAIIAGTGHGKSQFIQRLVHADLVAAQRERRSVVVIDSQGDLINRLVRLKLFSPRETGGLAHRLVLIDPADVEFPPALNLFDAHLDRLSDYGPADRERVLNGVIELYETLFADLLGAELTSKQGVVWKYLARLMLTIPGATIHTLMEVMTDGQPFRPYMDRLEGSARRFFEMEFFAPGFAQTKRQILRRLWGVLSTATFERMFAQPSNKLDLFKALQDGSIILVNTAKDLLKTEGSQLFGRFFIKVIAQAALERSTVDPSERTPTMVFVDEAQEYFDDTTETLLNQARKYRVAIHSAFQTIEMLSPRLRAVLLADTSMKCAGGVSARDARALADELHTTAEFIEGMRRTREQTEFAVWLKHRTPHAIRLPVPLGYVEQQPMLLDAEYAELLAVNRERYCGTLDEAAGFNAHRAIVADDAGGSPELPERLVQRQSLEDERIAKPDVVHSQRPRATARRSSAGPGKGGPHHKYLQQLVRQLAEERGFRAVVEEAVVGGQVDVGLHRDELSIACEISVTSTPQYEAQNLAKCLRAGFVRVWAIAPDPKRRRLIQEQATARLGIDDAAHIDFLTTEELVEALDALTLPQMEKKVVQGYRVTTRFKPISAEDAKARRADIARIVAKALRRSEP